MQPGRRTEPTELGLRQVSDYGRPVEPGCRVEPNEASFRMEQAKPAVTRNRWNTVTVRNQWIRNIRWNSRNSRGEMDISMSLRSSGTNRFWTGTAERAQSKPNR